MPTYKVEWEDIGEGWYGDYDPNDPSDTKLLRFYVIDSDTGEAVEDASFCTRLPVGTPPEQLQVATAAILDAMKFDPGPRRRALQSLSWTNPEDLKVSP